MQKSQLLFAFVTIGSVFQFTMAIAQMSVPPSGGGFTNPKTQAAYTQGRAAIAKGPYLVQASKALPRVVDLPGYKVNLTKDALTKINVVEATRRADKATLSVRLVSTPNKAALQGFLFRDGINRATFFPPGSPSGKPLGQQSWRTQTDTKGAAPDFELRVLDGPSLIFMRMNSHIGQDKEGHLQYKAVTQADRLLCEHIARVMLKRLKRLKLTHDTFKRK